jgi:hypothetical protein
MINILGYLIIKDKNLKRLFGLESLFVSRQIPKGRRSEAGVGLLDAGKLVHALRDLGDVCLNLKTKNA